MSEATELIAKQMAAGANIARIWNFLFNVKAVPYNAKGDGTDDTAAIQSAINAAIAAHSKSVFFPYGTYSATALTGLDQVNLIGDNATLTVGGASQTIEQFGIGSSLVQGLSKNAAIYAKALEQVSTTPGGSLDHAKNAIYTGKALKVAFWGDSITEGADQASSEDTYVTRVTNALRTALPGITLTMFNFGVGGAGISSANDAAFVGGSGIFTQSWAVAGKSWYNHVKDFNPDLVVVAFGMNDAGAGEDNTYNNLVTLTNNMKTWISAPSVVLVPNMLSVKDASKFFGLNNQYTLKVARVTREFGKANGIAVADVNRLFQILRDGVDDVSRTGFAETNFLGFPSLWTGSTSDFTLSGTALTVKSGLIGRFVQRSRTFYNGIIEFDVNIPGSGINNPAWINYRDDSGNAGTITLQIGAGASSTGFAALYTNESGSPLINITGLNIPVGTNAHVRIEVKDTLHTVYVNSVQVLNYTMFKKMNNGSVTFGGSGLVPTYSNLTITYEDPIQGNPFYSEDDLLGKYNSPESGNGMNHPSGLGHAVVFAPAFTGVIKELSRVIENSLFLPSRLPAGWTIPGGGYPLTTVAGEKLYYKFVPKYDKYKGIALRRMDNGNYYALSKVAIGDPTIGQLEPGKFAYYNSDATNDFIWISVPAAGAVTWDTDLYTYK